LQFKDFYRQFRAKERQSFEAAKEYALACFELLPVKVHWKLFLEMADLAKRENRIEEARRLYRRVCHLQPHASQGWLEYSKMEEECGDMDAAARVLEKGLLFCEYSENLLARAMRHAERKGDLGGARQLLSRLRHVGIDKVWRTVLEGALLEARAGNDAVARKVFQYLIGHVPWYGPIYNEAFRLEEKCEQHAAALSIVERGLTEIPRYGPLWFGAFRLCERLDMEAGREALARGQVPDLVRTREVISRALGSISKELIWKVHFEAAQIEERAASLAAVVRVLARAGLDGKSWSSAPTAAAAAAAAAAIPKARDELLERCRHCYVEAVLSSPSNLRWKVWLAGARTELGTGKVEAARALLRRAFQEVPEKSKAHVFLECARLEEFCGDVGKARKILARARMEARGEWKVFLESVLLEMRAGEWGRAVEEARSALTIHTGTGRLWAILVQLRYVEGDGEQLLVLRQALREVPKSGEVWCEGARIHLSPVSRSFDLGMAEKYLDFAIQFTPQYGDSFLELLRLVMLRQVVGPVAEQIVAGWSKEEEEGCGGVPVAAAGVPVEKRGLEAFMATDTEELELRCSNADPNYGLFWFHCRDLPSDTPRLLVRRAKALLAQDLAVLFPLYLRAFLRRARVERRVGRKEGGRREEGVDEVDDKMKDRKGEEVGSGSSNSSSSSSSTPIIESGEAAAGTGTIKKEEGEEEGEEGKEEMDVNDKKAATTVTTSSSSSSNVHLLERKRKQALARAEEARARRLEKEVEKAMRVEPEVSPVVLDPEEREVRMEGGDFVTGLVGLNRIASRVGELSDEEKRKILFGSDQLVP
jgi:la-related protein 1